MSKYGFGDDTTQIKLPPPKPAAPKPSPTAVADAAKVGEGLGFVPREPQHPPPPPTAGRRRKRGTEPQDKLFLSGPARVIQAFRDHADAAGLAYWEALESLLKKGNS